MIFRFRFKDFIANIVVIFANSNPHLWVQTTFMSLWFYSVAIINMRWVTIEMISISPAKKGLFQRS